MIRVCFVCLGNICRSPTAEGVMRHLVSELKLDQQIEIDSAGTAAYHEGAPPDGRSTLTARKRGIELSGQGRQFRAADWDRFDYVIAMDSANYGDLAESAPTDAVLKKLHLLRSFDAASPAGASVPDPYYGGGRGFDEVLDLCFAGCRGLLERIIAEHGLSSRS